LRQIGRRFEKEEELISPLRRMRLALAGAGLLEATGTIAT
jgi:hypothetical protein